jgi:hypothetical protein
MTLAQAPSSSRLPRLLVALEAVLRSGRETSPEGSVPEAGVLRGQALGEEAGSGRLCPHQWINPLWIQMASDLMGDAVMRRAALFTTLSPP